MSPFSIERDSQPPVATSPSITEPTIEPPQLPSEEVFEQWAHKRPRSLLQLLTADLMDAADTALAAEVAARILSGDNLVRALLALLEHSSAIVREASLYGLARHGAGRRDVLSALENANRPDLEPSAAVREAASDVLTWLHD